MRRSLRQLLALLKVALLVDLRSGGSFRGQRPRAQLTFTLTLILYFFVGSALATGMAPELPFFLRIVTYLAVTGIFVAFNILAEYQHILLSPSDMDVLYWRPIGARTLFFARVLHILVYVSFLSAVTLAVPTLDVVLLHGGMHKGLVWASFATAGFLNAVAAATLVLVVYAWLLRYVSRERFHDVLVWVQIAMGIVVLAVYQGLDPVFASLDWLAADIPWWLHLFPAAWFAHLPALAAGSGEGPHALFFLSGLLLLVLGGGYAGRFLAPHYAMDLVEADVQASTDVQAGRWEDSTGGFRQMPRRWVLRFLGDNAMRRAGFEFLLSQLKGDRRLKVSLVPALAMPVVYLLFGLFASGLGDPYGTTWKTTSSGVATGSSLERQVVISLFGSTYLFVLVTLLTIRSFASSPGWRAAWVFFAAPIRRFDTFYVGVLYGAAYGLLLPAASFVLLVLLLAWRQPVHAMAHLALPVGASVLGASIVLALDPAVPFAREPLRHERSWNLMTGLLVLVPIGFLVRLHYELREQPLLLVGLGFLVALTGVVCFHFARRRLRLRPLLRSFDD